jgi:hypothetical protein
MKSSETSGSNYQVSVLHVSEDFNCYQQCCKNLKSYIVISYLKTENYQFYAQRKSTLQTVVKNKLSV